MSDFGPMNCSMPGLPITSSQSLLKHISIESGMPSNYLTLCHPLILPPSIFWVFSSGSFQMSQFFPSDGQSWSFSFSISPSNEYSRLIYFRMDWLDLLEVQGTFFSSQQMVILAIKFIYIYIYIYIPI